MAQAPSENSTRRNRCRRRRLYDGSCGTNIFPNESQRQQHTDDHRCDYLFWPANNLFRAIVLIKVLYWVTYICVLSSSLDFYGVRLPHRQL
jgi:hypothetical protein